MPLVIRRQNIPESHATVDNPFIRTVEDEDGIKEEVRLSDQASRVSGRWIEAVARQVLRNMSPVTRGRLGRCYELTGNKIMGDLFGKPDNNLILVHGHIKNKIDPTLIPELDHAWIEKGNQVWEPISDKWWGKSAYYALFDATVEAKYTRDEALEKMRRFKHYGPWK